MNGWDYTTDLVVVGSGGGGMTAALTAKDNGCDALVIEKGSLYGGSTAMSGGANWMTCNLLMEGAGIHDSDEEAVSYLKAITRDKVPEDRLRAYVDNGPGMVRYLEERSRVRFEVVKGYSDYYPDAEGGKAEGGRTIEPVPISGYTLKELWQEQRQMPTQGRIFGRILQTAYEFHLMVDSSATGRLRAAKYILSYFLNPFRVFARREDSRLSLGSALTARLRLSLADREIPLWLNTAAREFITEGEAVAGVKAVRDGKPVCIRAKKGVILAAGGFERNREMREKYHRGPVSDKWTVGNPENTGDIIRMGQEMGAALGLMDEAWWMSTALVPGSELPYMILVERSLAGSMMVTAKGKRFVNEAAPYIDVVNAQCARHSEGENAVPAFLIMDRRYQKRYPIGPIMPAASPKAYIAEGFVKTADTIEELAKECGIDPEGLAAEVKRHNQFAGTGRDADFKKGDSPIDRYYSDPNAKPNPCLGALESPPFYAIEVWPGDLGTKGGLVTDARARVLREDGSPIEGLYAVGNCSASVMGDTYAGAGATIGPSMVFGYIAAKHAARDSQATLT